MLSALLFNTSLIETNFVTFSFSKWEIQAVNLSNLPKVTQTSNSNG